MHFLHFLSSFSPSQGNCLSFLFINQKMKVDLAISSPPLLIFLSSFLSCQGMCDERALPVWSCRDPFCCQQHGFLCRTLFDEFACFKILFVCVCVCGCLLYLCKKHVRIFGVYVHIFPRVFSGACHVWRVPGAASGTLRTTPAAIWTTPRSLPTS